MHEWDPSGLLRRIRRSADLSQRQLAEACGVSASVVARVEAGRREPSLRLLRQAAALAGVRVALLDEHGAELVPMRADAVRDAGGRLLPAHLDTRHGDEQWWGGPHRPRLRQPRYTYDLDRRVRDALRLQHGEQPDHHLPSAGDSLADRAAARRDARNEAASRERERRFLAGELPPSPPDPVCSCPPGCDDLLDAELRVPHVADCPCRCDVS